ncbi:multicopper oxidase family protein [Tomitella gaofuii]|uniref:multicopper oxidase family protein n=1 Tax=Tomitella gaofuii TaxID=2760083 RepID=UPI001F2C346C|nr:multicopper oxidase domain-containing protein [Tomitella gaofuii]
MMHPGRRDTTRSSAAPAVRRRDLLRGTAALGLAAGFVGLADGRTPASAANAFHYPDGVRSPLLFHSPRLEPFRDALPVLPTLRGTALDMTASNGRHRFHRDLPPAPSFGYNGRSHLGPTIEAESGTPSTLTFRNALGRHPFADDIDVTLSGVKKSYGDFPPTSFHLHGSPTAPDSDGHPMRLSWPGQGDVHHFPNSTEACHLWYHDHAMGITRLNVYAGLAGMHLVRDAFDTGRADNPLGLPAGEFENVLVLQEKILTDDGGMNARSTWIVPEGSWEGGSAGDVGVVNGVVWPRMPVARGLYRFRIINADSFSTWNLHLSTRARFWVIGNGGGLLDAPVPTTAVRLAPAERIDVLIDFSGHSPGDLIELRNDEEPVFQAAILGERAMPLFCRFEVGAARGFTGPVPHTLRGGRRQPALLPPLAAPSRTRDVTVSQPYALRMPPAMMTLNNLRWSDPQIETPRQGTIEQWNIINITPDPHPIHLHLVMFRILGRTPLRTLEYQAAHPQPPLGVKWAPSAERFLAGPMAPPAAWERGWKDTVLVPGGSVTRIIVRFPTAEELGFDPDAPFSAAPSMPGARPYPPGAPDPDDAAEMRGYVWHCHLLDHEDHEMMLRYRTLA